MASNRIGRINEEIQKELASLLRNLKDPRVQNTMISITRVETTPDLRYAKVYASFLEDNKANDALKGLKSAGGFQTLQRIVCLVVLQETGVDLGITQVGGGLHPGDGDHGILHTGILQIPEQACQLLLDLLVDSSDSIGCHCDFLLL